MKRVLITEASTGFGHGAAMRLAEKGFDVIATVEIWAQVQTLRRQAAARAVSPGKRHALAIKGGRRSLIARCEITHFPTAWGTERVET
jgi:NAD(P)-dependent dehydrogenase (short-subunit alcohol dehydrogenase family)